MSEEKVKILAYNVRTKEKGVEMQDPVIKKTAKNAYMASGHDGKGNNLTTLLGKDKAYLALQQGVATSAFGDEWKEQPPITEQPQPKPKEVVEEPATDQPEVEDRDAAEQAPAPTPDADDLPE